MSQYFRSQVPYMEMSDAEINNEMNARRDSGPVAAGECWRQRREVETSLSRWSPYTHISPSSS